jgi:hypothetical protein
MRFPIAIFASVFLASAALAADWTTYANARFGETIDIPPGFVNDVAAPENGDGLTFHSADGKAELLVWGGNLVDGGFTADAEQRVSSETEDGWDISYGKSSGADWQVYSGTKGERIVYARSMASCKGTQSLHFRLEYPVAQKKDYDAIVERLSTSLKAGPASDCP